ncbi:type I-F CRISPR-associated endoribonuclease Cas6/Csy4 [Teredinibacter purpureus]|uniref:type I-F CRISPR-associated endoribonuclease Cas6/Csy4 n=1 Tax=Teredinibacter purpureus TaxID=2731756 RepID=UPI0005F84DFA|nr:type I-F CRISPR-associated endoribonuclease Cas6/Csy4 [Teredinibacter purpureus]
MNHYVDVKLFPDAEIPSSVLMNAIYTKFHKALCDLGARAIGVSFPKFNVTLCNLLRLHGSEADLSALLQQNWLGGMSSYCTLSEIQEVPVNTKHRAVSRRQSNMSEAKLKRLIKRGSITEVEAKAYRAKMFSNGLDNPYIELTSASNGHKHRRYIEFGELLDSPVEGEFDQFGLSKTATVPWF